MNQRQQTVVILDYGSQLSQLIARRAREVQVYSELLPYDVPAGQVERLDPVGFILSGGPASVYEPGAPQLPDYVLKSGKPVLGICYGMQLVCQATGGQVAPATKREYGPADIEITAETDPIFSPLVETGRNRAGEARPRLRVWMSHGDRITQLPPGFRALARTANSPVAAMGDPQRALYGVQFHPESHHTPRGREIIKNFLYNVCGCTGNWTTGNFIEQALEGIKAQVGDGQVVCGLSGGVDSAVVAALLHKAIGDQLTCIFVNTGLMRLGEPEQVVETFSHRLRAHLVAVDASEDFLSALAGVTDPEQKRKIIGEKFIRIFEAEARKLGQVDFLAQGTLYPDVIESTAPDRNVGARIKSHHNVGGLPQDMQFALVEPLRYLFKDEVRAAGRALGLPDEIVWRHPFPGPGLAVRILGEVTWARLETLRRADAIFIQALRQSGWYGKTSQAFAVLLPVQSVGVMGDSRTYADAIALRAVTTEDFMTADWARLPESVLAQISNRIVNEVPGVNRVVYDVTSKPPATIEWE
ncbi:MAG: glutamine-hydrolyzing GMP synthase [Anaerolineae bacterium]